MGKQEAHEYALLLYEKRAALGKKKELVPDVVDEWKIENMEVGVLFRKVRQGGS